MELWTEISIAVLTVKTFFQSVLTKNEMSKFVNFLTGFQCMFLKTVFSTEILSTRDRILYIYIYNSVSSVERITLMAIIEAQMGQNGRKSTCAQLFI